MSQLGRREIDLTLLGHTGLDPWYGTTSSARGAMFVTHIGQAPEVNGNESRYFLTGAELEYAKYTHDVRFPEDCRVLHVLRKYPTGIGKDSIRSNPVTTIIYENYFDKYKTIGVLHVPEYMSHHQDFGYELVKNREVWETIAPNEMFSKDTVIAQSGAVKKDGTLGMGVNANVVFLSAAGTIEDGFVANKNFLKRMMPTSYSTAVANAGRKAFFLNMYGDDKIYKPFPDIGDVIRPDGVIFAIRDHDDDLAPAEMTPRALRTLDRTFDRAVIGTPGAKVIDIDIWRDERVNPSPTPTGMDAQLVKYHTHLSSYYRELLKIYRGLLARRKDDLHITEEFERLIVTAQMFLPQPDNVRKLSRFYRLDPLDEWRVEVTYKAQKMPAGAFKMTDFHGGN
ncbi:RNA polymerase beta subunit [Pseudomonas phage phiKZ]|uniref:PHIKZ071 n=1 Tax=Pseudomonas phage phiKZ TaxID=2905945 RepID=Q8SD91_BPDPK|nr:RNA polymerase beta subunit [Pseudomonas phage phiKZ]AAL82972.1 PHIKZ071 [Pseudomonas phage phiKZ]